MKKIIALLMALMMLAVVGAAAAETLDFVPGTPTACPFPAFQTYFTALAGGTGYTFTWDAEPAEEDAYTVYSAVSEDKTLKVRVFVQDGNVSYLQAEGAISLDLTDLAAAQKFGEWFGVSISGGVLGMALGSGDTSVLQDPELDATLQADVQPLVYILENDFNEKTLAAGKAAVSTVFGYPCGLEVSGSIDGATVLLAMKIIVSGPEGQVSVK